MNFWTIEVPDGWSVLFTHPFNRLDLPFTTLTGVVDCDRVKDGLVHFPVVLKPDFEGTIAKGTPVVQVVPVPRGGLSLDVGTMTEEAVARLNTVREELQADPGVYRKRFRAKEKI